MRIDIVTIFPNFFDVLDLSLLGKAKDAGKITVNIHDLRDYATDSHKTVDDTPYGGGPGMVMKPDVWGLALDAIFAEVDLSKTVLVIPSPAGEVFKQSIAAELAEVENIIFACGRYEGIDQRVFDWAATKATTRALSLGDYVLNGGEVAVVAMVEAIARLRPGFMGNSESVAQDSHQDALLDYPAYTKPASWRGFDVPEVLLSGNHAAIDKWRREQQIELTQKIRPDLLADS
ncbi:MAG: tRNA (guanosine(37)-N1)-methyltransferase TrmD [Microbacteriaceae bacterium]|nr:tRNA (guanosine(37)-N1)-methyltransferase TrmD [Microbacteriaceae bacterium]